MTTAKGSFQQVFESLKAVFVPYAGRLAVQVDKPDQYYLETKKPMRQGRAFQFGGVKIGKAYVSFHLMPLYMNPRLQAAISPELKRRMQGKSCFNFTRIKPDHIAELNKLTQAGFEELQTWGQKFGSP